MSGDLAHLVERRREDARHVYVGLPVRESAGESRDEWLRHAPAYRDRSLFSPPDHEPIQEAVNPFLDAIGTRSLQLHALVANALADGGIAGVDPEDYLDYPPMGEGISSAPTERLRPQSRSFVFTTRHVLPWPPYSAPNVRESGSPAMPSAGGSLSGE